MTAARSPTRTTLYGIAYETNDKVSSRVKRANEKGIQTGVTVSGTNAGHLVSEAHFDEGRSTGFRNPGDNDSNSNRKSQ